MTKGSAGMTAPSFRRLTPENVIPVGRVPRLDRGIDPENVIPALDPENVIPVGLVPRLDRGIDPENVIPGLTRNPY
jgi:hypothetical protein